MCIRDRYHIHYEDIAVRIFKELERLMAILGEDGFLEKVSCPAIVVQAKDDAVADPESAGKIFDRIASEKKELYTPDYGEHNIVLTAVSYTHLDVYKRQVLYLILQQIKMTFSTITAHWPMLSITEAQLWKPLRNTDTEK